MSKELINKLRKAGIDASLVSRVHDSEVIDIRSECNEEQACTLVSAYFEAYPQVKRWANYIEEMDKAKQESIVSGKPIITGGQGYVETLSGSRRYLRRKPTMDNNNTLR
jgi:DNA polymerase I-like protein with 3'-5' exonuclease and polymerase domains